jgi:hypothetical protein
LLPGVVAGKARKQARWEPIEESEGNTDSARLLCYGDAAELGRVHALNVHFSEPYIAMRLLPAFNTRTAVFVVGVYFLAGVLLMLTIPDPISTRFVVPGLALAIVWVYPRLFPEYYRVSPGRIEVLNFPLFGSRGRIVKSADLTQARVVCRYDQRRLHIAAEDDAGKTMTIDLWALSAPHEFAEAVFRSCLCTRQVSRLPQDELLG